jgi:hypothetical protein
MKRELHGVAHVPFLFLLEALLVKLGSLISLFRRLAWTDTGIAGQSVPHYNT